MRRLDFKLRLVALAVLVAVGTVIVMSSHASTPRAMAQDTNVTLTTAASPVGCATVTAQLSSDTSTVSPGSEWTFPKNSYVKVRVNVAEGCTFSRWTLDFGGGVTFDLFENPSRFQLSEDMTVTAHLTVPEVCTQTTLGQGPAQVPALAKDCNILMAAKDALRGTGTLNWSADTAITGWDGVTVSGTPSRVTGLALRLRGLTGRVPATLGALGALRSLDLSWNKLTGSIPATLGHLRELSSLSLSRTSLGGSIPPELGDLAKLEQLSLSQSFFRSAIPAELGKLTNLKGLYLYQNRLTGSIPPELATLSSLERLFLGENAITGCVPPDLGRVANNDLATLGLEFCSLQEVCSSGTPVSNPANNPALVEDCTALLGWRDTLAGTATLNWSGGRAMSDWTGVTVAGTPQRVMKLSLASGSLSGEISGLLGELASLKELRLNGNALTGRIPSKVALLTNLTHVYLADNALTGCVPPSLRTVANNDRATLGLPECGAPVALDSSYEDPTLTAGSYRFIWPGQSGRDDSPAIFDVPKGLEVREDLVIGDGGGRGLILEDATTGRFWIGIDVEQGVVYGRGVDAPSDESDGSVDESALVKLFDRLAESVWLDQGDLTTPGGSPVRSAHGHTARNLIINNKHDSSNDYTIVVCTSDYPNATRVAVQMWNDHLRGKAGYLKDPDNDRDPFSETDAFKLQSCPPSATSNDKIDYVSVTSVDRSSIRCNTSTTSHGCFHSSGRRSGQPLFTYTGHLEITMNEASRPMADDSINDMMKDDYRKLVRTIAHELGHVLGLDDYDCVDTPPVPKSLMLCSDVAIDTFKVHWAYPLQEQDFADYKALYEPNLVSKRGTQSFVEEVSGQPGRVNINFDATAVQVDQHIEIRSWDTSTSKWLMIPEGSEPWTIRKRDVSTDPSTGMEVKTDVKEETIELTGQPAGLKRYGIFRATRAYLEGQEQGLVPDPDSPGMTITDWIGFVQPVGAFVLTLEDAEYGHLVADPSQAIYAPGKPVEITAMPDDGYMVSEWDGACSGSATTCDVTMDADKTVAVEFTKVPRAIQARLVTIPFGQLLPVDCNAQECGSVTIRLHQSEEDLVGTPIDDDDIVVDGDRVSFTVSMKPRWRFTGWSSTTLPASSNNPYIITVSGDFTAFANFKLKPAGPTGLTAARGNSRITLTWTDPSDASITKYQYRLKARPDADGAAWGDWTDIPSGTSGAAGASTATLTTYTIPNLTNDTLYALQIRAVNTAGASEPSAEVRATPKAPIVPTYLCWDGSRVENLSDCPEDTRPICWNGERVDNLSDCPEDTRPICWNGERVENLSDCPEDTRPICWNGERVENLSDCPEDTRPICWNGERVENLSDCPEDTRPICWNGERVENLSDCPEDTRPICWNGERVENLSDCPEDTRPICWNGDRVENLSDCPEDTRVTCWDGSKEATQADCPTEYCWSGTCNIRGATGGSCGIATQTAAQSAYNTFRDSCPKSDISTNIFEVTQWYADVTCNNGTKFTLGPASSRGAAVTLGQGGLLACSAGGSSDAMGLSGRTLTRSELRDALRARLEATSSPTNIDDVLPEEEPSEGATGTQGASQEESTHGFSTLFLLGEHHASVTCEDGTKYRIGPAATLKEAISDGLFGLIVCANRNILTGLTLPEAGTSVSRSQLETHVKAILAALPTPLEIDDLSMDTGASGTSKDGVTGQSGTYRVYSVSTWSWTGTCTGANDGSGSGYTTATAAGNAALHWASTAGCSPGGATGGVTSR